MNSTQLELGLGDVRSRVPWNGVPPRALTKAAKALFLRREPLKDDDFFIDVHQLSLFEVVQQGPRDLPGAPLLVEPATARRVR